MEIWRENPVHSSKCVMGLLSPSQGVHVQIAMFQLQPGLKNEVSQGFGKPVGLRCEEVSGSKGCLGSVYSLLVKQSCSLLMP